MSSIAALPDGHHDPGEIEISVTGRVCLFGEHSDWAGGFRSSNADIETGQVIVVGTEQSVDARVRRQDGVLTMISTGNDGKQIGPWSCPMSRTELLKAAREGGFWSYVAGVAYVRVFPTPQEDKTGVYSRLAATEQGAPLLHRVAVC